MNPAGTADVADRLIEAYDGLRTLAPITASDPSFDVAAAYAVLNEIHARRLASGWEPVGRKIAFTNRRLWPLYGVERPNWAYVYARTVRYAGEDRTSIGISGFLQPRIEPEVVFGLRAAVPVAGDARSVLDAVAWVAAGFEIVQCPFPEWRFRAPDCTAACGLHAALVVGVPQPLDGPARDRLAAGLRACELRLHRDDEIVDQGRGSDVLDSPALALQHLARVLASQPDGPPLAAGEIVTTGTLTDAWPLHPGTRWRSDYGALGVPGLELEIV